MNVHRPVLRYHGGKWRLARWLVPLLPPHRNYVEPFGGGASILLRKKRSYAEVYNDLDGAVVNLFQVLRSERSRELVEAVALTPFAREEFDLAKLPSDDPVERARRLLVLSHMGFSAAALFGRPTSFRGTAKRSGTTPAIDWSRFPPIVMAVAQRLRAVVIEQRDALELMPIYDDERTLFYVDPPYVWSSRSEKRREGGDKPYHAYRHELDDDGHRRLAETLRSLKGMVMLSGYASDLYRELYGDWLVLTHNAVAEHGRKVEELLWCNGKAAQHLAQLQHSFADLD